MKGENEKSFLSLKPVSHFFPIISVPADTALTQRGSNYFFLEKLTANVNVNTNFTKKSRLQWQPYYTKARRLMYVVEGNKQVTTFNKLT